MLSHCRENGSDVVEAQRWVRKFLKHRMHNIRKHKLYYPVLEGNIAPEIAVVDAKDDEIFERDVLNLIEGRK